MSYSLPISYFISLTVLPLKTGNSQVCPARGEGTSNLSPGDAALWRAGTVPVGPERQAVWEVALLLPSAFNFVDFLNRYKRKK